MTTVRMTDKLQKEILSNAEAMFTKRIQEASKVPDRFGDRLYEAWLADGNDKIIAVIGAQSSLDKWTELQSVIYVGNIGDYLINQHFDLSTKQPIPRSDRTYNKINISNKHIELYAEYAKWRDDLAALVKEQTEFATNVKRIVSQAINLKRALEAWPGLWDLVPQHARDQHNTKAQRGRTQTEQIQVDVDQLNVTLVTAKLVESVI